MVKYLAFQHNYKGIDIALFSNNQMVDSLSEDKIRASKNILLLADKLLKKNKVSLNDLSFIAANQGPGPFTTLRVIITTVNGISFATKLPLVGVDGILAFLNEYRSTEVTTVALLNAYSKDVYYAIGLPSGELVDSGYDNIESFLRKTSGQFAGKSISFIGNGTELYKEEIELFFKKQALIEKKNPQTCSIKQIGKEAFAQWNSTEYKTTNLLFPMYLKKGTYKQSIT